MTYVGQWEQRGVFGVSGTAPFNADDEASALRHVEGIVARYGIVGAINVRAVETIVYEFVAPDGTKGFQWMA